MRRFIPACAGNAGEHDFTSNGIAVHPRVCGERYEVYPGLLHGGGSSPRVRGTHAPVIVLVVLDRFIPACAGNAAHAAALAAANSVHPRVCGERAIRRFCIECFCGSSPRVRGTPGTRAEATHHTRFIPACAGNAFGNDRRTQEGPVHPRVCGERFGHRGGGPAWRGSSPRVRGTP